MGALDVAVRGRPTILSEEIITKVIAHLSKGNYVRPSVEAAGISYETFRTWVQKGEADRAAGVDSPYSTLSARLAHAQAEAEATLVDGLRGAEDWRAQAFILERRHRDRWGKEQAEAKASVTVQLPAELAGVLVDVLRVAKARPVLDAEYSELPRQQVVNQELPSESEADASQMLDKPSR